MNKGPEGKVGYKNPPRHSRWKPGQSGNPNHKRRAKQATGAALLEELLLESREVIEDGASRRMSNLDLILRQLYSKAIAGDGRAAKVLLAYQELWADVAPREKPEIIVNWLSRQGAQISKESHDDL